GAVGNRRDVVQVEHAAGAAGLQGAVLVVVGRQVGVAGHQRQRQRDAAADEEVRAVDVGHQAQGHGGPADGELAESGRGQGRQRQHAGGVEGDGHALKRGQGGDQDGAAVGGRQGGETVLVVGGAAVVVHEARQGRQVHRAAGGVGRDVDGAV